MEKSPNKSKSGNKQHVLKKLLYDKKNKKSSLSKKSENPKKTSETSGKQLEEINEDSRPSSPDPNCVICLEPLQNKSFTNSCFHTFCFTCLLEWSKVKPECPLCKQQFSSIVHNVQQDLTFEEYHISTTKQLIAELRTERRFRYPTTLTHQRIMERNMVHEESYQSRITSHRMRYAPHSVQRSYGPNPPLHRPRMPCPFRQRVYQENLWVRPPIGGRKRFVSPLFFKHNPACTHRLVPWLNRELVSLLPDSEAQVTFVLELIMSLVARYDMTSDEFHIHILPYMGSNTRHFIHELYHFAISPHDMDMYDIHASYNLTLRYSSPSSPDSDVIPIFDERQYLERRRNRKTSSKKTLEKLVLKKKGKNTWESIIASSSSSSSSSSIATTSNWSNPGPSTSGLSATNALLTLYNNNSEFEHTDNEECQIINVLKPRRERTPEIVDLSSDEEVPVKVIDVSSGEEDFIPLDLSSRSPPMETNSTNETSSDIECVYQIHNLSLKFQSSTSKEVAEPTSSTLADVIEPSLSTLSAEISEPTSTTEVSKPFLSTSTMEISPIFSSISTTEFAEPSSTEVAEPSSTEIAEPSSTEIAEPSAEIAEPSSTEFSEPTSTEFSEPSEKFAEGLNEVVSNQTVKTEQKRKLSESNSSSATEECSDTPTETKKPRLQSAIVRPWAMAGESSHGSSNSSYMKVNKRRDSSMSLSSSDTECSNDRQANSRKLKLRRVVAHFSYDNSDSHRSSHKRRKDKKRNKKRKHTHHKHRFISDSESDCD